MKKLKSNNGSSMVVAIILMLMTTIIVATITMQVTNQINYNKMNEQNIGTKYVAEAGIENTIALAVEQVEYKLDTLNNSDKTKTELTSYEKNYDKYAKVKKDLIDAKSKLMDINGDYDFIKIMKSQLDIIINRSYISTNDIRRDIENFKYQSIQQLALQSNQIKNETKLNVYDCLKKVDLSLIKIYESFHKGDDHKPLDIPFGWYGDSIKYVKSDFIKNHFEYIDKSYSLGYIIGQMDIIINQKIINLKLSSGVNFWEINNTIEWLKDKAISVKGYLNNGVLNSSGNNYSIRSLMNFEANKDSYDLELKNLKSGICSNVDKAIEYNIYFFEKELIKMYIEDYGNYTKINDETKFKLDEILQILQNIKYNLIETKCKLGITNQNIGGDIDESEEVVKPPQELDNIRLEIVSYENKLSSSERYIVNQISEEIPIKVDVTKVDDKAIIKIKEVKDIEFDIVSTGYIEDNNKYDYKIKATVVLKTSKLGNDFITTYSVVAYDKISK